MLAVDICSRPGVWARAGQTGTPVGLDWRACEVLIPAGCDRDRVLALCRFYENGLVEGAAQTARRMAKEAGRN